MPKEIVVYRASWCGDCKVAESILQNQGVVYLERDIESDPVARAEFDALVGDQPRSIPRILFRDGQTLESMAVVETVIEPTPQVLVAALRTHGYVKV